MNAGGMPLLTELSFLIWFLATNMAALRASEAGQNV
jgi:hypothetical protein